MALENVINEIYEKGRQEVQRIKEEAEKEAERIIAEAKEKAEEILRKAKEEGEKEAERLRRQEISSVKLEMKRQMLDVQKRILDGVFEALKQRIREMDVETRRKLTMVLLKSAVPGMVVYSRKEDEDLVKSIIQEMKLDVKYGGYVECLGGVVLESEDGEVRLNLTFDELLNRLYEQKMGDVAKILFG
jgi:V/A-type H+-transporting ATPase subunit E